MIVINQSKIDPAVKKNLKVLATMNLDFYVGGSLLCQYYLKDHARYTKDIDLVISNNPREIEEEFKKAFGQIEFTCSNGTEKFYEPYFTCYTKIDGLRGIYMPYAIYHFTHDGTTTNSGRKYSHRSGDYQYYNENYALNGEFNFDIKYLE